MVILSRSALVRLLGRRWPRSRWGAWELFHLSSLSRWTPTQSRSGTFLQERHCCPLWTTVYCRAFVVLGAR